MALRPAGTATAESPVASNIPPFEVEDEGNSNTTNVASEVVDAKRASTGLQVVVPTKNELVQARPALDKNTLLRGLQNAIPTEELAPMGVGVFPRITAALGGFVVNKNEAKLGTRIRVEVLSWNYIWLITTGEQNNTEANKLIRTSYDNRTIKDGSGTVEDYVKALKADGYDKTEVKQYIEVYVNLTAYEEKKDKTFVVVEVPDDEQKIYQISLSPQSVGQWGKYMLEGSLRKARGHSDDSVVTLVQEEKTIGPNTFAYASFTPKW